MSVKFFFWNLVVIQQLLLIAGVAFAKVALKPEDVEPFSHPDYVVHVEDNQIASFEGKVFGIINHAATRWDFAQQSLPGIQRLLEYTARNSIPTLGVVSSTGPGHQFYDQSQVTHIVHSYSGQHRLLFPTVQTFLIAGGRLSECLCEFMRDAFIGSEETNQSLDLILVTDAIYDDFYVEKVLQTAPGEINLLSRVVELTRSNPKLLINNLGMGFIGAADMRFANAKDRAFCPGQNYFHVPNIKRENYRFEIYGQDSSHLHTFGNGSRIVRMWLKNSESLDELILD